MRRERGLSGAQVAVEISVCELRRKFNGFPWFDRARIEEDCFCNNFVGGCGGVAKNKTRNFEN